MTDIKKQIKELVSDNDFEELCLSFSDANIFKILSDEKNELKHSNFISYLLNPYETHGLNSLFLAKFIREVFSEQKDGATRSVLDLADLNFTDVQVLREWKNIDILVVMTDDVFCIENKINIQDHDGQLEKYFKIVNDEFPQKHIHKHFIYLTPFGSSPQQVEMEKNYHNMSYQTISDILSSIVAVYKTKINNRVLTYLNDYITILNRDILMNDNELNDKAARLYKKYEAAIEFIYNNKPDASSILYPFFEKELKERGFVIGSKGKGYIRFTTQNLDKKIPKNGTGWSGKEAFLFEIDYFKSSDKNAVFRAVISPGDAATRDKIISAVNNKINSNKKHYKDPKGEDWRVFYSESFNFKATDIAAKDSSTIENEVKKIIDSLESSCKEIASDIEKNF